MISRTGRQTGPRLLPDLPRAGLVAWYDLTNLAAGIHSVANRYSGAGALQLGDGTEGDAGEPTITPAGLQFDGSNDYCSAGDATALRIGAGGTMIVVLKPTAYPGAGAYGLIVNKGNWNGGKNYYALWMQQSNHMLYADVGDGAGHDAFSVDYLTALPLDTWACAAMTWDGAAVVFYLNGGVIGSPAAAARTPNTTGYSFLVGGGIGGTYLQAVVAGIVVYSRVLGAGEMARSYRWLKRTLAAGGVALP